MNQKIDPKTGRDVIIEKNCLFQGIKGKEGQITLGDYSILKNNCRFYITKKFEMGDYSILQNNVLVQCYKNCKIGHNAWIGQNSIINATDDLEIGNNFGIGVDSKIWTHAFHGELLLGCRIAVGIPDYESKSGAIKIGDDFWGIGQITISPGVKIGDKVIALTNSLITKDIPDNCIVAGIPAKRISIKGDFHGYKDLTEKEKYNFMKNTAKKFSEINNVKMSFDDSLKKIILGEKEVIIICNSSEFEKDSDGSFFDIIKRTYTKKHNYLEKEFIKFTIGYRARFIPI